MQMNACREGTRPFHHGRIEMRMRDRDCIDAAESFNQCDSGVIERGDAIPQDIAVVGVYEQRALPNGKCRRRADADNALFVFVKGIGMAVPECVKRGPRLSSRGDVLPLFFTDQALSGRLRTLGMLRATGGANVEDHQCIPLVQEAFFDRAASTGYEHAGDRALSHSIVVFVAMRGFVYRRKRDVACSGTRREWPS